jgi:glutathione S-transferase
MQTFYYAPGTCALASHIALEDAGAAYQLQCVDFTAGAQHSTEFLEINPKARVPALVTPRGILTETTAILAYIAQSYPQAGLAPLDDPFGFAEIQAINSYICSTLHVAHAHRMRGNRWASEPEAIEAMKRKVPESVAAAYTHVENDVFKGPFVMGHAYTIVDPYLFTVAQWMESDGVDPSRFPKIRAHREMMRQRKPVQEALEAEGNTTYNTA